MSARAKFRCLESTRRFTHTDADGVDQFHYRVKLVPVFGTKKGAYAPCPENEVFYAATPSGEIELTMVSPAAAAAFVPGQAYYIDFTPVDG